MAGSNKELLGYDEAVSQLSTMIESGGNPFRGMHFAEFIKDVYSLSIPNFQFAWFHQEICDGIEESWKNGRKALVCLPRYFSKCLDPEADILLKRGGYKKLKDIEIGDELIAFDELGALSNGRVMWKERNNKPLYTLKTKLGRELRLSPEHRVYSNLVWKPFKEVCEGDYIAVPKQVYYRSSSGLTKSIARFLGYWYSEGNTDVRSIFITNSEEFIREDLKSIALENNWTCKEQGKYGLRFIRDKNKWKKIHRYSTPIHYFKHILKISNKEHLPTCLLQADRKTMREFLDALWMGDGYVNKLGTIVGITQKSKSFLQDVQLILLAFGIVSSIKPNKVIFNNKELLYWTLSVTDGESLQNFSALGLKKYHPNFKLFQDNLDRRKYIKDKLPNPRELIKNIPSRSAFIRGYTYSTCTRDKLLKLGVATKHKDLIKIANSDIYWDRVTSIDRSDIEQPVIDIGLSDGHVFVANNILVHNSSLFAYGLTCWSLFKMQDPTVMYTSFKEEQAKYHTANIKAAIENNPELKLYLRDLIPDAEMTLRYKVEGGGTAKIFSGGVFSAKRGFHTGLVLCLTPDTKIRKATRKEKEIGRGTTLRPISCVKVGDYVKTHLGRLMPVTQVFVREISEEICYLRLETGEKIGVTKNHRILTTRGWVHAGELVVSDILVTPKITSKEYMKGRTYEEIYGSILGSKLRRLRKITLDKCKDKTYKKRGPRAPRLDFICPSCKRVIKRDLLPSQFKLKKLCNSCTQRGRTKGSNNPNWRGGISRLPWSYEFKFGEIRKEIRELYHYACQNCGIMEKDLVGYHTELDVHHIDYDKQNDNRTNLIPLCKKCHSKTNYNREYWTKFFMDKLPVVNGTKILSLEHKMYTGKVYNLEVEMDNTYAGKGVIFHNCDDLLVQPGNPLLHTQLRKVEEQFTKEISQIPLQGGFLLVVGTPMAPNDLLSVLRENKEYDTFWYPALHPKPGVPVLWPEMFPQDWLEKKRTEIGDHSFRSEFLLHPAITENSFFTVDDLTPVIDKSLKARSLYEEPFPERIHCYGGLDVGKKRHPASFTVMAAIGKTLVQVHQKFFDGADYSDQVDYMAQAISAFNIERIWIDNTRGEMEERGIPRPVCRLIVLGTRTAGVAVAKSEFGILADKFIKQKKVKLLDDARFISHLLSVDNGLESYETSSGHGDGFWSFALALGAYNETNPDGEGGRTSTIGNLASLLNSNAVRYNKVIGNKNVCPFCGTQRGLEYSNQSGRCGVEDADKFFCLSCGVKFNREEYVNAIRGNVKATE